MTRLVYKKFPSLAGNWDCSQVLDDVSQLVVSQANECFKTILPITATQWSIRLVVRPAVMPASTNR